MKKLLLLVSVILVGCSTVDVHQSSRMTETHYTNGVVVIDRFVDSQMSGVGEAKQIIDKLQASQTKAGTISVGANGVSSEATSPALVEFIKQLQLMMELGKALAK